VMRVSPVVVAAHTRITAVGGASRTTLIPSHTGCQPPRVALAARAHAVTAVRLSAPQSADRSVQPRSNRRCALPHLIAPEGHSSKHRRRCAVPVRRILLAPTPPPGALRIACHSWREAASPLLPLSLCGRSLSLPGFALYCRRTLASRPGLAARTRRTATAFWPPAKAVCRAKQASVLADRGRRPCMCRGRGGARACRTRRWRWQVDRVVATCPHAPRASLRSQGRSSGL